MQQHQEDELLRIRELLRRTGEFIAYFELAETKMMVWRQDIEQQTKNIQTQTQNVLKELESVQALLSEAGTANFRVTAEKALTQGEMNIKNLEHSSSLLLQNLQHQQEQLKHITRLSIEKIDQHSTQALNQITTQLAKYDAHHFHRTASESCDHIERVAQDAISKSNKLLKIFHFRANVATLVTTILTAFVIVLYLSGELPWEMHHQALNERHAGKLLLQAWPHLNQAEKDKILSSKTIKHG